MANKNTWAEPTEGAPTPKNKNKKKKLYEIGLLKIKCVHPEVWPSEARFPSHGLLRIKCVHLEVQRTRLHVLTVSARLTGKFQVSHESSPIHSIFAAVRRGFH
jgi:hypothetical protein